MRDPSLTSRAYYRPGDAEAAYAAYRFLRSDLTLRDLEAAERSAEGGGSRGCIRALRRLRGEYPNGQNTRMR
jgi:hypothetical protein